MIFNRKDKNGRPIRVELKIADTAQDALFCTIYVKRPYTRVTFWGIVTKTEYRWTDVWVNIKDFATVREWTCQQVLDWMESEIVLFNKKVERDEHDNTFKKMIKNGCDEQVIN